MGGEGAAVMGKVLAAPRGERDLADRSERSAVKIFGRVRTDPEATFVSAAP